MRLGLFLTPGAARAAYQVGAAQALVDSGLRFDVVAASSVGSLNGAFVATGQVDELVALWTRWTSRDIVGVDWRALLRGAIWWAPNLMHNRPQRESAIDPYVHESRLLEGTRLRFNLADLGSGGQRFFEWPGGELPLPDAVDASVAVPGAIRPAEALGRQWADGLTVDGFPVEQLALSTGIERLFVLGVAPRTPDGRRARTVYDVLLASLEANQYSETRFGIERAEAVNREIRAWEDEFRRVREALATVQDAQRRERLLAEAERLHATAGFPYERPPVEIVPVLPERRTPMFFTSYRPARSRALLEAGRRDARRVLAELGG